MPKKGKDHQKQVASKHVTTRRLARWQREKRRQRITFVAGIAIIVIVIGIIIGGVIATRSSDWLSRVQTESGTITIKKADYLDELKLFRVGIYNSSTMTNESPLLMIENNLLIEDGADLAQVTVSDAEVTETIRSSFESDNQSISDANFEQQYHDYIDRLGISDQEFRKTVRTQMLSQQLLLHYVNNTDTSGEQARVETIAVTNESDATELTQRWRSGESFSALSREYGNNSQSGWLPEGYVGGDFDNVAFTIEIGNVSDPISMGNTSDTGSPSLYYVIKVLERKYDIIPESIRQEWGYSDFNTWYSEAYTDKVERNLKIDMGEIYAWAVRQLS